MLFYRYPCFSSGSRPGRGNRPAAPASPADAAPAPDSSMPQPGSIMDKMQIKQTNLLTFFILK